VHVRADALGKELLLLDLEDGFDPALKGKLQACQGRVVGVAGDLDQQKVACVAHQQANAKDVAKAYGCGTLKEDAILTP
jgi:hypothetical protein